MNEPQSSEPDFTPPAPPQRTSKDRRNSLIDAGPAAVTLSGDTTALGEFMGLLDREMTGFYMHQR